MAANEPALNLKDFHLGADVYSSDGVKAGRLVHVLVDTDYKLQAFVIKESAGFSGRRLAPGSFLVADEVIVPKDAVRSVTHERVDLAIGSADLRRLPPYLSFRQKAETPTEEAEDLVAVLTQSPELVHWFEEVANKPDSELEIDGGENVMLGRTGRKLGEVKDVLFEGEQLVGVVLKPGLFRQDVILPRRFLDRSDDAALFANLDEKDLEHLTPFAPNE